MSGEEFLSQLTNLGFNVYEVGGNDANLKKYKTQKSLLIYWETG